MGGGGARDGGGGRGAHRGPSSPWGHPLRASRTARALSHWGTVVTEGWRSARLGHTLVARVHGGRQDHEGWGKYIHRGVTKVCPGPRARVAQGPA